MKISQGNTTRPSASRPVGMHTPLRKFSDKRYRQGGKGRLPGKQKLPLVISACSGLALMFPNRGMMRLVPACRKTEAWEFK